ncbi:MAG: hypothetical protein AAB340_01460 [Patescibacteria group bacterium]
MTDDEIKATVVAAVAENEKNRILQEKAAKDEKRVDGAEAQQRGLISLINESFLGQRAKKSDLVSFWTLVVLIVSYLAGYFSPGTNFDLVQFVRTTFNL